MSRILDEKRLSKDLFSALTAPPRSAD